MELRKIILVPIFIILSNIIIAQNDLYDPNNLIRDNLGGVIRTEFGENYDFNFWIFDSIFIHQDNFLSTNKYYNPYNSLTKCILFSAYPKISSTIVENYCALGIYKDGNIIWHTEPLINGYSSILKYTGELNIDNNVEIIFSISNIFDNSIERLWIVSWDGTNGSIINDYDETSGYSKLVVDGFELVDLHKNGIWDIYSKVPNDYEIKNWYPSELITAVNRVTYGWNGQKYGLWSTTSQIGEYEFLPANDFDVAVITDVKENNSQFLYIYSIKNDRTSFQDIGRIFLVDVNATGNLFSPPSNFNDWISGKLKILNNCVWWSNSGMDISALIKPGEEKSGFSILNSNLPKIVKYFIQANVQMPSIADSSDNLLNSQALLDDILNNSKTGFTIGPQESNNIDLFELLDSLLYYNNRSYDLEWIKDGPTYNKYNTSLTSTKAALEQDNNNTARANLQSILTEVDVDSSSNLTSEAYALLKFNTEYLLEQIPEDQTNPNLTVRLESSQGNLVTTGSLQYYESGWKDAVNNGDGTFNVITDRATVSLKMNYAGASQQLNNVAVGPDTAVFQTVNATVKLLNSQGTPIDTCTVKYYASGWKDLGTTVNGIAAKELLPKEYSFRMSYGGTSLDKKQNISDGAAVIFQTVNAKVQLKDSQGNLLPVPTGDGGSVKYYASGWKNYGDAVNGEVTKELLPKEYSFRMNYGGASQDKKQDIGTDSVVVFQTVNAKVQLKDSQGNLLDGGSVKYYASGWKDFGTATNGEAAKELLPKEYSFRMNYDGASIDRKQDIGTDPVVVFQTVNAKVQLKDSQGNLLLVPSGDGGTVKYYASGWKDFGAATNGEATKELLPKEYSFRMSYGGASLDKKQDIGTDSVVVFQTVNAKVQLKDSQGNLLNGGTVKYYASGWKEFGTASNGEVTKELLPKEYSFRMSYGGASIDEKNDISVNQTLVFNTINTIVRVSDGNGQPINNALASYYASGWKQIGNTINGEINKELLPKNYSFRVNNNGVNQDKQQDINVNNIVEFIFE